MNTIDRCHLHSMCHVRDTNQETSWQTDTYIVVMYIVCIYDIHQRVPHYHQPHTPHHPYSLTHSQTHSLPSFLTEDSQTHRLTPSLPSSLTHSSSDSLSLVVSVIIWFIFFSCGDNPCWPQSLKPRALTGKNTHATATAFLSTAIGPSKEWRRREGQSKEEGSSVSESVRQWGSESICGSVCERVRLRRCEKSVIVCYIKQSLLLIIRTCRSTSDHVQHQWQMPLQIHRHRQRFYTGPEVLLAVSLVCRTTVRQRVRES